MLQIIYNQDVANNSHGLLGVHQPAHNELVFVSPQLALAGCPTTNAGAAIDWCALNKNLRLVSRKQTKMVSRTVREMTLTLEVTQ